MDMTVPIVFVAVYAGMLLGEIPGLALDRAGVALLGAIARRGGSASRSAGANTRGSASPSPC
jgi:hypothetical protein